MKRVVGSIDPSDKNVTIWGAGFSGLILAHYLKDQGYSVKVHEISNSIGGKIQSVKNSLGIIERGPNALYMNADGMDLLNSLGLEPVPASKKIKRLLMTNGKPKRPFQFKVLTKLILNGGERPPLTSDGLTVADFFRPLIGQENLNNFLSPILSGIYAAPAEQLHFKSVFDDLSEVAQYQSYWAFLRHMRKNMKSRPKLDVMGSVSFEGGMQKLIDALAANLTNDIVLSSKKEFEISGNTIICTDSQNASLLLKGSRPHLSSELARIKYQQLSSVTVFLKKEIRSLNKSFGVVIPLGGNFHSIGILNNKATFPINYSNTFSYTFITPKNSSEQDITADIKLLFPEFSPEDIEHIESTHWQKALPIYNLNRYLSIKKLHQLAKDEKNLAIFGNYVAGISLREMISAARAFVQNPQAYQEIK